MEYTEAEYEGFVKGFSTEFAAPDVTSNEFIAELLRSP